MLADLGCLANVKLANNFHAVFHPSLTCCISALYITVEDFGAVNQCAMFWNYLRSRDFTVKTCFLLSHSVTQYENVKYINADKIVEHFLPHRNTFVFQVEHSLKLPSRDICLRHFSCYRLLLDSEEYNACKSWKIINIVTAYNFYILSFAFERHYWIYYRLWTEKQWLKQILTKSKCKS